MNPSQNIYFYRLDKGLTQAELAKRSGVPQANISGIEKGRDLKLSTLCQIAAALEVEPSDLLKDPKSLELDKSRFFRRKTIDQVADSLAGMKSGLRDSQALEAVALLRPMLKTDLRGVSKKSLHHNWIKIRQTFTDEELETIAARTEKARQRRSRP